MWPRFGIKVGNSTLCVASAKNDGNIEVIANKHGDRVSQAVLLYDGDEVEVGLTAKQKMISKAKSTVNNSFQLFPKELSDEEIERALKHINCKYDKSKRDFCLLDLDDDNVVKNVSITDVYIELFKTCFELARQCHFYEEHPSVVLSIPDYFPNSCWQDLADVAEKAGFNVAQIVTETTAALIANESAENDDESKFILCIKSGGLLTSFTLYEVYCGTYSVISSSQPFYLGGKQFSDVLTDFIAEEFRKKYHLDPKESRRSMTKIRIAADNCKHTLTTLPSTQIYIDSLMDGVDFNIQMSRARFESIIQPVINEFVTILTNSLEEINKEKHVIKEIILSGGTLKIPKIQATIKSKFPDANLKINFAPDEIVAIGCAQQSIYINPKVKELKPDISCTLTTEDVFIWCNNNIEGRKLLVKKGTILPNKAIVDLEDLNEKDNENVTFNIQTNENVQQIQVSYVKKIEEMLKIEALIDIDIDVLQVKLKLI